MKDRIVDFLGKISINFKRSEITYRNYIEAGKTYIHAKILKECNREIRDLLLFNCFLLSENLQKDALRLIVHYDIWLEKWNELELKNKPGLDDEFIFQNKCTFPKDAEENLLNEFSKLKKDYLNI